MTPGALQHTTFRVPDEAALLTMRDRVRSHGVPVIGPVDHGFCKSLFAGPEAMTLEVSTFTTPVEPAVWIDRAMLASLDVSEAEARRCLPRRPMPDHRRCFSQLMIRPCRTLTYPKAQYDRILAIPDSVYENRPAFPPPNNP